MIDYNTAEITFTANQLITKDKRIAVEFQYSDANYLRTMVQTSTGIRSEKLETYINFYSEQDSKNQPLQQDLTENDQRILDAAGDDVSQAIAPAFNTVSEFNNDQVLYTLVDSLGYDSIFVRATEADQTVFSVNFSEVGQGNADYIQAGFDATGRIFEWQAPDTLNGLILRQGSFAPVRLLVAPRRSQTLMAGANYKFSERTKAMVETGFSNADLNTFSNQGNGDNISPALFAVVEHLQPLTKEEDGLALKAGASVEAIGANFQPIEPYRSVEFNRNWNLSPDQLIQNQNIITGSLGLVKGEKVQVDYRLNRFEAGSSYTGIKNELNGKFQTDGFNTWFDGSILSTNGTTKTRFSRHKSRTEKTLWITKIGFEDEREDNQRFINNSDTLASNAYRFYDWQFYLASLDSSQIAYKIFYRERDDFTTDGTDLGESTHASHYGADLSWVINAQNQLKTTISNRILNITNPELTAETPESTLIGRVEYSSRWFKNSVVSNIYYEIGSGLERRQEFIYVLDPTGQALIHG